MERWLMVVRSPAGIGRRLMQAKLDRLGSMARKSERCRSDTVKWSDRVLFQ